MRWFYSAILWLLIAQLAAAQDQVLFSGTVTDSTGAPIELAHVVALDQRTNHIVSYGVTDYQGKFVLRLLPESDYQLKVSFVGFETYQSTVKGSALYDTPWHIELRPSSEELQALEIVDEFPVMISGDTIIYRADAFTNGTERKLQDVLGALPGFEVDEYGDVRVQGKQVEKILVEGKEFFEGDTKLAVQNIPASAVEKVQVLRNFNDISPMSPVGDDDRLALNIKLDDNKKNLIFGDVTGGAGLKNRYLGHVNFFSYGPKATFNFIGDANNIGRQAFTSRDYFRFTGGLRGLSNGSGSSLTVRNDDLGLSALRNNTALNIDTKLGAFNFNLVPNKIWKITGFAIANRIKNDIQSNNLRTYIVESENNLENVSTSEARSHVAGMTKLNVSFTPNENVHLAYDIFSRASHQSSDLLRLTDFLGTSSGITNASDQRPYNVNQVVSAYWAKGDRNIFSAEANYSFALQNPLQTLSTSDVLFSGSLPLIVEDTVEFSQYKSIKTQQHESLLNWYHIINPKNHINFSFGNTHSTQRLHSTISQPGNAQLSSPEFNNIVQYRFSDVYAGLSFKSKWGKLTFNPGINLHRYRIQDNQLAVNNTSNKVLWLPEVTLDYQLSSSQNLRFTYALEANFSDVQTLASGLVVQNYNSLYQGNRQLTNSLYHNLNLNYYNFSMFSHITIYGGLNYQQRYDDITEALTFQNLQRLYKPINTAQVNELITVYGSITKTYTNFKVKANTNIYMASLANIIDEQNNRNNTHRQQLDLSAESKFFKVLTVELGFEGLFNQYRSTGFSSSFRNYKPYFQLDWALIEGLTLSMDYEQNYYQSSGGTTKSTYNFLNAQVTFQVAKSPWQFQLESLNLLNTKAIRRDSFVESQINTFTYFVQPQYFLFSLTYDI